MVQVIETMSQEELERLRELVLDREAADNCPTDMAFSEARAIHARLLAFRCELHEKYDLDDSEQITLSAVSGYILYGD